MITKEIACLIYNCYSEIENSNEMIEELKKNLNGKGELGITKSWGELPCLELRIPTAQLCRSIHKVPFRLALDVIKEHIANQEAELIRLKEICKVQLHE